MGFIDRALPNGTGLHRMYILGSMGYDLVSKKGWSSFYAAFRLYLIRRKQYSIWMEKNEPDEEELKEISAEGSKLSYRPKLSLIMPTWNTRVDCLRAAIESVLDQTYGNWELCIADGGSTEPFVKDLLMEYLKRDSRIKVNFLAQNQGISGNSNQALSLAEGEFVGFLDHDDELAPFALFEVVKLLNERPELDFIYSDEDKINEKGKRSSPFFKPDWSPDMFLACNYPIHITILRKSLVDKLGGFREGYDGSQDYELLLRLTEIVEGKKIARIPKILYHWRTISGSTAIYNESKPYAVEAAKRALNDSMNRRSREIEEVQDGLWPGSYRIKYKIIGDPRVSIIIPTRDKSDVLRKCIDSIIEKTVYQSYEIIIVDNQSQESETFRYYDEVNSNKKIRILHYDEAFNYSSINNFAVSQCDSEYVLFLNNDTEVITSEWLAAMLEHARRPEVGAVGAKLLYTNGRIQHCGIIMGYGDPPIAGHHYQRYPDHHGYIGVINTIRNFSAVTGACMLTKKALFEEVGGLEERNLAFAFNDIDYCLKLRDKGYLIIYTPYAKLYHHESLSRGYEDTPEKEERYSKDVKYLRSKWGHIIDKGDPYYNPNLSLDRMDFSLKV